MIIGQYRVLLKIGEGGMGEVYRARDTKLGRDVAIKVLPAAFSEDNERLRRFEQEAQASGALNHPNILVIHHIGTHQGAPYIVSELLEGETLRERMAGAALPQRKAIDYALQITHGLAAAHAKGIVHRDLKPENLFITNDGRVKILDFGLAKLTGVSDSNQSQTDVPTRRVDTDPGAVMGTMGYMSPEQLRGKPADHRSDIFSFGTILYEMLSGKRAFRGDSAADTMSAILREDPPDLSATNKNVAPALERIINHCLEKNPEERFHSASDLAFALEAISGSSGVSSQTLTAMTSLPVRSRISKQLPWIAAALMALAFVAGLPFAVWYFRRLPQDPRAARVSIPLPEKLTSFYIPVISPDGSRLVFAGREPSGKNLLYIRALDSFDAQPLAGTEGSAFPFWSPDSRFIAFCADRKLKKVEITGGPLQTLCDAPVGRGGTWNSNGVIIFAPNDLGGLYRVSATGGEPTSLTTPDKSRQETTHRWPYFLPDGRHFLYFIRSSQPQNRAISVGVLDGKETTRLINGESNVAYAPPGYLLFWRDRTLWAQAFDASKLQLAGDPFPVAEQVGYVQSNSYAVFSVSGNGILIYRSGTFSNRNQPTWFDRRGNQLGTIGTIGDYRATQLSPDEKRVALEQWDSQATSTDIWLFELARGTGSRFTTNPSFDSAPVWSPDGNRIAFSSNRDGQYELYIKPASGIENEEVLLKSSNLKITNDWSADGRLIIYEERDLKQHFHIWVLPLFGDGKPFPLPQTEFNEQSAQLSPNGKWIAYVSDESGKFEVYVQSFPASGGKWKISTDGGHHPLWLGGTELIYITPSRKLMAVNVKASSTFEVSVPRELFETRISGVGFRRNYDVTADGQRFLVITQDEEEKPSPISVVFNWTADLKR
ncbi:hypothetical protein BH20ACI3_BH20ACI3_18250 [soil metagenome]